MGLHRYGRKYDLASLKVRRTVPCKCYGIGFGNATAQIDPLGNRTEFTYDGLNRQTRVKDALTGETVTKYDFAGNVLEVTDPEQNTTSFTYDARNRLTSETNELGVRLMSGV